MFFLLVSPLDDEEEDDSSTVVDFLLQSYPGQLGTTTFHKQDFPGSLSAPEGTPVEYAGV